MDERSPLEWMQLYKEAATRVEELAALLVELVAQEKRLEELLERAQGARHDAITAIAGKGGDALNAWNMHVLSKWKRDETPRKRRKVRR